MLGRNQDAVSRKFTRFLIKQGITEERVLKELEDGLCYGFSVCRGAMRITGKLPWWEACLYLILTWDEKNSSLLKKYILPGAKENEPISLREIFQRVISYILFNHAGRACYPYLKLDQLNFLLPDGLFVLLDENDSILRVATNKRIAGYFTAKNLTKSLEDADTRESIKHNITLVSSDDHTCELGFKGECWSFFDPNYNNGKAKLFKSLKSLTREIFKVLGQNLYLEIAYLNNHQSCLEPFAYYHASILKQSPQVLLREKGLIHIAEATPHIIPSLILRLKELNKMKYFKPNATVDCIGRTALMILARYGHVNEMKLLLENGADIEQVDKQHQTAFMHAAKKMQIAAMNLLIDFGANCNEVDKYGINALMQAAKDNNLSVVDRLLEIGADPDMADYSGRTALMYAAENNLNSIVTKLKSAAYLDLNAADEDGKTALMLAVKKGHIKIVKMLISFGADINKKDAKDWTALHYAVYFNHLDLVKEVVACEKIKIDSKMLKSLINLAKKENHLQIKAFLKTIERKLTYKNHRRSSNHHATFFADNTRKRKRKKPEQDADESKKTNTHLPLKKKIKYLHVN